VLLAVKGIAFEAMMGPLANILVERMVTGASLLDRRPFGLSCFRCVSHAILLLEVSMASHTEFPTGPCLEQYLKE
jgi:hypothetical protein